MLDGLNKKLLWLATARGQPLMLCKLDIKMHDIADQACVSEVHASTILASCQVKTVRFLVTTLEEAGFRVAMLHGERSQPEREVLPDQQSFFFSTMWTIHTV